MVSRRPHADKFEASTNNPQSITASKNHSVFAGAFIGHREHSHAEVAATNDSIARTFVEVAKVFGPTSRWKNTWRLPGDTLGMVVNNRPPGFRNARIARSGSLGSSKCST